MIIVLEPMDPLFLLRLDMVNYTSYLVDIPLDRVYLFKVDD